MMRRSVVLAVVAACLWPAAVAAQGILGGQGFGYPAGQLGARSAGTASALAPFDAVSPVNPASVSDWLRGVIFFHAEPEFRSTSAGGQASSTRATRFPLMGGGARISPKLAMGFTVSTYLDRTWATTATSTDTVGGTAVALSKRFASAGAINDLRFALAWTLRPKLRLGAAVHAYTGQNRVSIAWVFPDSTPFLGVTRTSTLAYTGSAFSAGAEWAGVSHLVVAAYGRLGNTARLRVGDTLVRTARMPNHVGLALRYDGIKGTLVAAGWERITWTAMRDLGQSLGVHDSEKLSLGAESRGPQVAGAPLFLRLGVSRRVLPFDANTGIVHESMFSFGAGMSVSSGRGNIDLALQRANRTAGTATERAWLLSLGLAITP
jgi:hypothetical protein